MPEQRSRGAHVPTCHGGVGARLLTRVEAATPLYLLVVAVVAYAHTSAPLLLPMDTTAPPCSLAATELRQHGLQRRQSLDRIHAASRHLELTPPRRAPPCVVPVHGASFPGAGALRGTGFLDSVGKPAAARACSLDPR